MRESKLDPARFYSSSIEMLFSVLRELSALGAKVFVKSITTGLVSSYGMLQFQASEYHQAKNTRGQRREAIIKRWHMNSSYGITRSEVLLV